MAKTVKITPASGILEFIGTIATAATTTAKFTVDTGGSLTLDLPASTAISVNGKLTASTAKFGDLRDSTDYSGSLGEVLISNGNGTYYWGSPAQSIADLDTVTSAGSVTANAITVGEVTSPAFIIENEGQLMSPDSDSRIWRFTGATFSTSANETNVTGIHVSPDGANLYVTGTAGDNVVRYTMSTPWNLSTLAVVNESAGVGDASPQDVFFKPDGTKMYVLGNSGTSVREFTLATAWNISSITFVQALNFGAYDTGPRGLWFKDDGTKLFILGDTNNIVIEYALPTPWSLTGATYTTSLALSTSDESTLTGISFNSTGTRMWVAGSLQDNIVEYGLSTGWSVSTATVMYRTYIGETVSNCTGIHVSSGPIAYLTEAATIYELSASGGNDLALKADTAVFTNSVYVTNDLEVNSTLTVFGTVKIDSPVTVNSTITTTSSITVGANLFVSASVTWTTATGNYSLGASQTTGTITMGGPAQTGTILIGQSTVTQILALGTGATASGSTKTINIGTNGLSGSTTAITIGSSVAGATSTVTIYGAALQGVPTAPTASAGTNTTQIATTAFVTSAVSTAISSAGTVTSVSASVPTGLSVSVTNPSSTPAIAIAYAAGYSIPTTASQTNWDTAYSDRLKWDGGSTGLVAATGRTSLGATTLGSNFFTLANVAAISFPRINADNSISTLDAATFRTAIGAGTGTGSVTSVSASVPTGLSVSVTNASTTPAIAITYTAGYSIPTTAAQTNWTTAYGWGNHASAGYAYASALSDYVQKVGDTMTGVLTMDGPNVYVEFANNNPGTPTFNMTSDGTRILLRTAYSANTVDYAMGYQDQAMWWSVPAANSNTYNFAWYGGETLIMRLVDNGDLIINGSLTENSSIRYKENVSSLDPVWTKIDQLKPVKYNKIGNTETEIGLIAEDVAQVFPEVVNYDDLGRPDGVNYTRFSSILIKAVQELSAEIKKLKNNS